MLRTLSMSLFLAACIDGDELATVESELSIASNIQVVAAHSYYNGNSTKELDLVCPTGMVGTQFAFGADTGSAALTDFAFGAEPIGTGRRWRARATDPSNSPSWNFSAFLTCIPTPDGYELVTATSAVDASDTRDLLVGCPDGKLLIGAGFRAVEEVVTRWPSPQLAGKLTYSMPFADGTSWYAAARTLDPGTAWELQGTLVCADRDALPGYHVAFASQPAALTTAIHGSSECAGYGYNTLGGGWSGLDANDTIVEAIGYSEGRSRSRGIYGHQAWARRDDGAFDPWKLEVAAICVH